MWSIILKTLSLKKVALFSYSLASLAFGWMFVALFPSFKDDAVGFDELIQAYPEELLQAFNISSISANTIEDFLAFEHVALLWPLLAIFMVVSFAGSFITKEIEKGTIEILLSRPVSRTRLFLGRYIGSLIALIVFTLISYVPLPLFAELYDVTYRLDHYVVTAIGSFLFGAAILSAAFMVATFFSERNKAYGVIGGGLLAMYFAKVITNFNEDFNDVKYASFFHYFDAEKLMVNAEFDTLSIAVFVSTILIATIIGILYFNKRDIAV